MEKKSNVLIIADRTDLFDSMQSILNNRKYRVAVAGDGAKAIDLIQKIHFDIVYLVDTTEIDGEDTYYEIKRYSPETIVMRMNIYDRKAKLDEVMSYRIDDQKIGELIN